MRAMFINDLKVVSVYCGVPFMQVHAFEHTTLLATPV